MNPLYSVSSRTNRSMLSIPAAVVVIAFLLLALHLFGELGQPVPLKITYPASAELSSHANPGAAISTGQLSPVVVPVPTPARSQFVQSAHLSITLVPAGIKSNFAPQPVATPPSGK